MLATLAMFVTGVAVLDRRAAAADRRHDAASTPSVLGHDMRYFAIAYAHRHRCGVPARSSRSGSKWIVAVVLLGIYAWYVKGHFEADADGRPRGPRAAPLPPPGPRRPRERSGRAAPAGRQPPGRRRARPDHRRRRLLRRRRRAPRDAASASTSALLALVIAPDRDGAAREVQLASSGSARARTPWRWATSPARWSSSPRIPTVVALLFASDAGSSAPGSYVAFASAGIAFLSSAVIFLPMARGGADCAAAACSSAACSTLAYLARLVVVAGRRAAGPRPAAGREPQLIYSADPAQEPTPHDHREVRRAPGRRPPHHAPGRRPRWTT